METQESAVVVRPMELRDVEQMSRWGVHEDPLFLPYNFPYHNVHDYILWYRSKRLLFKKYLFGVYLEERMIGYITLKHIKWLKKEAFMGVSFDPNYINQGYGTRAIAQYVEMVFSQYPLRTLKLKTAIFNYRGQKSYEKVGFQRYSVNFEPYEDQSQTFELLLRYPYFQMVGDELWTEYIYMKIDRDDVMKPLK